MEGKHHPKADVNRLYINRRNGRRGAVELETGYNVAIVGLIEYVKRRKGRLTGLLQRRDTRKTK